jgi:hypothetical protein
MGTIGDWMRVFLFGSFWVFLMLLLPFPKRKTANTKPAFLGTNVWVWISWGLFIGLFNAFYWKAFLRPLVFLTVPVLVGGLVAGWISRPEPALGTK